MQEFIGCIQQSTGTYCLQVVNAGSRFFSSLVSLLPEKCGPFIKTNITMVYNAVFQTSGIDFSIAANQIAGNCSALLPTTSSLLKCGSQVLGGLITEAEARSRTIGIGMLAGCGGLLLLILAVPTILYAKTKYSEGGCRLRLFKPAPAVSPRVERPVESAVVSAGEGSTSEVDERALLIPKPKDDKANAGCCVRFRGRK